MRPFRSPHTVRLVATWIKRIGGKRIRSEKLKEHQYTEGYAWSLECKGVEWYEDRNIQQM